MKKRYITLFVLLGMVLAACSSAAPAAEGVSDTSAAPDSDTMAAETTSSDTTADDDHDDMVDEPMADDMADEATAAEAMSSDVVAWQTVPLTDVRTGETFTLADFAGQTVFVEPMATWCTNCRRQLTNVQAARVQYGLDDIVFVGLSVETTISDAELAGYVNSTGFDWPFAVASPELLEMLVAEYGRTIVNPPSTPHFIIRPDGTATELSTGIDSPEEIQAMLVAEQGG